MKVKLDLAIRPQPDGETCGVTCLQAVYRYYGERVGLGKLIRQVARLADGGTLAAMLGCHALGRGYRATIFSYNLALFDPTWRRLPKAELGRRLRAQLRHKKAAKFRVATEAYLEFLEKGGKVRFEDLRPRLILHFLRRNVPVLTGLNATYLYQCARETGRPARVDDLRGRSMGHFVVLSGYHRAGRTVDISDPLGVNPLSSAQRYEVSIDRLINAILLGAVTSDGNLLIIERT